MSKSRIAENDSHLKRGAKKEKTYFKNNFGCAFVFGPSYRRCWWKSLF
ncbi:hypothetical protein [Lactococcus cremoris]|nr:hypothetical protein [Lactococcus cremoris]